MSKVLMDPADTLWQMKDPKVLARPKYVGKPIKKTCHKYLWTGWTP